MIGEHKEYSYGKFWLPFMVNRISSVLADEDTIYCWMSKAADVFIIHFENNEKIRSLAVSSELKRKESQVSTGINRNHFKHSTSVTLFYRCLRKKGTPEKHFTGKENVTSAYSTTHEYDWI